MISTRRLSDSILGTGPAVFYNQAFMTALEYHVPLLKNHPKAILLNVKPAEAYQFTGNLYGLLTSLGVPKQYHWIIMRCNDMYSPSEYDEALTALIQPPFDEIDIIQSTWSSNNNLAIG